MSQITSLGGNGNGNTTVSTLTGNSGGAVPPSLGNINIVGSGSVTITGNPSTNTLTISDSATAFTWNSVTTSSATMAPNNGYYVSYSGGPVSLILPTVMAFGATIQIASGTAQAITIVQNSGQQIQFGSSATTSGAGGSLSSTTIGDSMELLCVSANSLFNELFVQGNWTVV